LFSFVLAFDDEFEAAGFCGKRLFAAIVISVG
jgi:hypothetical protein